MQALVPILFVVTAFFSDEYPVWRTGRAPDQPFTVECEIRFPEETIKYPFKDQIIFQALNENKASSAYTQTSNFKVSTISLLYYPSFQYFCIRCYSWYHNIIPFNCLMV